MPAQRKEVLANAHRVRPRELFIQRTQQRLALIARGHIRPLVHLHLRHRQRPTIELAVGIERQRRHLHIQPRNHIPRQRPLQTRAQQLVPRQHPTRATHQIGHQTRLPSHLAQYHRRVRHRPLKPAGQRRLNLAQLNAKPPQLHLRVYTPHKLYRPITPTTRQVSRPIHAPPRTTKRIGHEALRSQPPTPHIPARQTQPRDIQLTHNTIHHRLQTTVQDVHLRVR